MSASKKKQERRAQALAAGDILTEKQKKELQDAKTAKRNTVIGAVVGVVIAVLVIILLVWHSGVIARSTTALTVNGTKYSVADMNYFYRQSLNSTYSNQQYYLQMYEQLGIDTADLPTFDPAGDLKTQLVDPEAEEPQSYHEFFQESAKQNAAQVAALCDAAKAAGYTLSEDAQKDFDDAINSIDEQMATYNYSSRNAYLKAVYGRSMNEKVYRKNIQRYILAYDYSNAVTSAMGDYSDAELEAYYQENPDTLDNYEYAYIYYDGTVASEKDDDGNVIKEPTEEEQAAAMAKAKADAEAALATYKAGGEDAAKLAFSHRNSMGSSISSVVYGEWLMDSARKDGDCDIFEVEGSGYYLVLFEERGRITTPTVDVRHILISTDLQDDPETPDVDERLDETNETVIAKKVEAQAILDQFLAGDKTAEAFGDLAEEHSGDGRDSEGKLNAAGGLYEKVAKGDMVAPFDAWIMDPSRQAGDTGLVLTQFGWHIMYFQESHRPQWQDQAESAKKAADQSAWAEQVNEGYEPVETKAFAQVGE